MFTGIVENIGKVVDLKKDDTNLHITIQSELATECYIDQSISHNGVCLTVVDIQPDRYTVTAIDETLRKTNLGRLSLGDEVNLERAMKSGQRLDGHFVQGHVDECVQCISVEDVKGSWNFRFSLPLHSYNLIVNKGSVTLNGISLTVVDPTDDSFGVSIIPYTYNHTNMRSLVKGEQVNIEYDMIAKHIVRHMNAYIENHKNKLTL